MTRSRLDAARSQILAFRRHVGSLDERLPEGADSLRRAAWAGLQDSMPRAALLSIHARMAGTTPTSWEDPSLVQLWGPRFSVYVVAARDRAVFSLARLPDDAHGRKVAEDLAARLQAGAGIDGDPNRLRYAAATGTVLIRWDGARRPTAWTVPRPDVDPQDARLELARRYLHVYGPTTPAAFTRWAGISGVQGREAFDSLSASLIAVRTPIGEAWILADDEPLLRSAPRAPAAARLLPSGDAFFLLHGADRELLVPDDRRRSTLWTSRVWPGALLVAGEPAGIWRRTKGDVTIEPWRRLARAERYAVEAEAQSLPLPALDGPIAVRWAV